YAGTATTMPMTDTTRFPDAMRPSWTNEGKSEGMGPCTFLTGAQWGTWEGRLAVGFLAGQRVEVLDLDAAGMTTSHTRLDLPRPASASARSCQTRTAISTLPCTPAQSGASPRGRRNPRVRENHHRTSVCRCSSSASAPGSDGRSRASCQVHGYCPWMDLSVQPARADPGWLT